MDTKYDDGLYHIELQKTLYFGGYYEWEWVLVNVHGEGCKKDGRTIRFSDKEAAQRYLDKVNQCPDGGLITNFT